MVKNRSLWDEFDKLYEKKPVSLDKVDEVERWVAEKTKKRPLTAMDIDAIYNEARKRLRKLLA